MCAFAVFGTQLQAAAPPQNKVNPSERALGPLSIKVYDDRMTIAMAGAAQVYLSGVIDLDAPERFAALLKSWKIPPDSDIYLNASGDDIDAGMALGRLLRSGSMSTHLGKPTRGARSKQGDKSSVCTGACVYTYLGGVYRWVPTGNDRFGITSYPAEPSKDAPTAQLTSRITAYLKNMGVAPAAFATLQAAAHNGVSWPSADQMVVSRLANNGRQPLIASYRVSGGIPHLELDQIRRRGEQRITLQCKPGSILLTAYNKVGLDRAQQIVKHATRSYVEIDRIETLSQTIGGAILDLDAVVVDRTWPPDQLDKLLSAKSLGAWINQPNGRLRYGFAFRMDGIDRVLKAFHDGCGKYAPAPIKSRS
ncbi:MAG: hypothetical protein ABI268_10095 [Rhodanobacter sp.]